MSPPPGPAPARTSSRRTGAAGTGHRAVAAAGGLGRRAARGRLPGPGWRRRRTTTPMC
ncbi:hypothetical protein LT493_26495 [Streptomyces tricolor]|nr:hypothetical protein [Streptomyces tricolor]